MRDKRKPLSKRVRFEVFKRDWFACVYCGRTPPTVILHVDHLLPVAEGGSDEMENLATACADCNGGKGSVRLDDLSATERMLANMEAEKERVAVIEEYARWRAERKAADDERHARLVESFEKTCCGKYNHAHIRTKQGIRRFMAVLFDDQFEQAMEIAKHKIPLEPWSRSREIRALREQQLEARARYFYGVCRKMAEQGGTE